MKKTGKPTNAKERVHFMIERDLMRRIRAKAKEDSRSLSHEAVHLIKLGMNQETEPA